MFTVAMADVLVRHLSVAVQLIAIGLLELNTRAKLRHRSQVTGLCSVPHDCSAPTSPHLGSMSAVVTQASAFL